jgi:hypothetical protein
MSKSVQTFKHISATRTPSGALWTATSRERGRKNEIPDYFLFVTWTGRLLRRWSVCERRRLRSHCGFGRLCPFSGAHHPHRPVVQSTGCESVRVELIAAHYPALPGNERRPALPFGSCAALVIRSHRSGRSIFSPGTSRATRVGHHGSYRQSTSGFGPVRCASRGTHRQ